MLNVKLEVKLRFKKVLLTLKPVTYCFRLEHHYQTGLFCSKFLYILATSVYFTDRNWIFKTVYSFVIKKVYHSFFGGSDRLLPLKTPSLFLKQPLPNLNFSEFPSSSPPSIVIFLVALSPEKQICCSWFDRHKTNIS